MPDPVWYKSLYWRIAFGFVAMLAALLLAQVLVFVWLTDRVVGWSAQSPEELVSSVASDLSTALTRNPEPPARNLRPRRVQPHLPAVRRRHGRRPGGVESSERAAARVPPRSAAAPAARRVAEHCRPARWWTRWARRPRSRIRPAARARLRPGGRSPDRERPPDAGWSGRTAGSVGHQTRGPPDGQRRPATDLAAAARLSECPDRARHRDRRGGKPIGFVVIPINPPPVFVAHSRARSDADVGRTDAAGDWRGERGAPDLQSGAPPAADARTGGARARRRPDRCPRRRRRRRRGQRAGARVQPDGRRPRRARRGAGRIGPRAAAVAGRRLARADDAAGGGARLHRNARDARAQPRRSRRAAAISASSATKPRSSNR